MKATDGPLLITNQRESLTLLSLCRLTVAARSLVFHDCGAPIRMGDVEVVHPAQFCGASGRYAQSRRNLLFCCED